MDPDLITPWSERAEAGPFTSVTTGELLTSQAYDPFVALTVAATVTRRLRLLTNVIVLPLHNAGIVAKQAASLDALSAGRLTVGLGVGARKPALAARAPAAHDELPDFPEAPAPAEGRYERFTEQIAHMQRIWRGEPLTKGVPAVGPPPATPGGPPLLVGGFAPRFLESSVSWAAGLTTFGLVPDVERMARDFSVVRHAWARAGRPAPQLVATHFFALGPDAEAGARAYIKHHYTHLGEEGRRAFEGAISTTTTDRVRDAFRRLVDAGATEVIPIPMIASLDQVDRLADALGDLVG